MSIVYPVTPNERQFFGATDSETIQNAVNYADANDLGRVVIPRYNARTGKCVWNIDAAILLPSNITVVLEDAHLRLADGCFDNIFRNRNCMTPEGNTLEGEQHNIHIIGSGNALLDGGVHNGLVEQMHRDDPKKYPRLSVNLLIFLHNITTQAQRGISFSESVKNMLVENLTTYGANEVGLRFTKNFECDNLVIRNVNIGSDPETLDSVFWMNRNPERMLKDLRVENVRANSAKYVFRETEFAVENLQYEAPSVAYYTPETTKLASAYGRYHRCAYGKVIENRPPDARYDSQGNKKQYVSAGHS